MLPLEAIAVVGFLYIFFMYATLKAMRLRVKEKEHLRVRERLSKAGREVETEMRPSEQPKIA